MDALQSRFRLLELLGKGGTAEVYRAKDLRLNRVVAIKLLPRGDGIGSLLSESRATAALSHPNIVMVHEVLDGAQPCVVMEFVAGETLQDRLAHRRVPVLDAVDVACQIASALEAAHAGGQLHGDLTSANVKVTPDGRVKVLDFGMARLDPADHPAGTLAYMSPERLEGQPSEAAGDVFALGVLVYEMLAGRRPFGGRGPADLAAAIIHDEPPPLASVVGEAPLELIGLVGRMLRKNPRDRPAARDLRPELEALRDRLRGRSAPPSSVPVGAAFRGLVPFHEADRDCFFGREHETTAFLDRLVQPEFRVGVLFGASGCGKSSLLRAGLVPRLWQRGDVPLYCRHYRDPLATLVEECRRRTQIAAEPSESAADYFQRVADRESATLVLLCDQFEAFFTGLPASEDREGFLSFLAACHTSRDPRVKCLLVVRRDCLHFIASNVEGRVPDLLSGSRLLHLSSFDAAQAEHIIEASARRAGLGFEPGLPHHVAQDLAVGGSVLPSELQIVGERLQGRRIFDVASYVRAGGKEALVNGFLDDVLAACGDRDTAALVLRSLISDDDTRLALPLEEVARRTQRMGPTVARLLQRFVDARLVQEIQDEEPWRYELMHEYLIERINRITGRIMDATQRANRLLRQYMSQSSADPRTRVPLRHVGFIRRYSDLPRGEKEHRLLRTSLRRGLIRAGAATVLLALGAFAAAAALSVTEEWEEAILDSGHSAAARRVAFSPDGRLLASSGEDRTVIVWDFARRERVATLTGHAGTVSALAFSPGGTLLVSGGHDGKVILWETARGFANAGVLTGHTGLVGAVGFSRDGRILASSGLETILWDLATQRRVREISTYSYDHGTLFFKSDDHTIFINNQAVDLVTGAPHEEEPACRGFTAPSSLDGQVASLDATGYLMVCDAEGGLLWQRRAHRDNGRAITWSPDGRWIATGSEDTVLWDAAHRTSVAHLEYPSVVWSVAFSPNGHWLVSSHGDGSIVVWDVAERARVGRFGGHGGPVRTVAFAADGRHAASAGEDRSAIVWDVETRRQEAVLLGHSTRVMGVAFVPGRADIVSMDQDGGTVIWDTAGRGPRGRFRPFPQLNSSHCLAVSPDGRWIANGRGVCRADTGELIADLYPCDFWGMAFSPDGRWLAVPCGSSLELRDTRTWRPSKSVPTANDENPVTLAFSPNSRQLVTGDDGGRVRLFAVEPLREVAVIGRHAARVKSVAFAPDGRHVASASDDKTIALWDVRTSRLVRRIGTHGAPVLALAFSPDGRRLVSGGHDSSVRLYTLHHVRWGRRLD